MSTFMFVLFLRFVKVIEGQTAIRPFGIQMCKDVCYHRGDCFSVKFSKENLVCRLHISGHGTSGNDGYIHPMISPKRCKTQEQLLQTKQNVVVCAKVQNGMQKDKAIVVAGPLPLCQYDLQYGSWNRIHQDEVPTKVGYSEESGFLYYVFAGNPRRRSRIERMQLSNQHQLTTLFTLKPGKGQVLELAVDGDQNIVFFTVQPTPYSPTTLMKIVSDNPSVIVDLEDVQTLGMITVNSHHRTLYCSVKWQRGRRIDKKGNLAELLYSGSLVESYPFPKGVHPVMMAFDKNENSLYCVCEKEGAIFSNLYKMSDLNSSQRFHLVLVLKTYTTLLMVSEDFIYTLGKGGYVYNKDMKLVGNITGGCLNLPHSGYILS